jgi:hypothetical protein
MGSDFSIDLNLKNLPARSSVGRVQGSPHPVEGEKPQKTLGDPLPKRADLADLPHRLRQAFSYEGILRKVERKLNALTGERYEIVPAAGDRVCIDEKGKVFVGVEFVAENVSQEALLAGVLAHEWGHFPTRSKLPRDLSHLTWEEVYRLRRGEETKADMFCGRALFMLGYPCEPMIQYLKAHEDPKNKTSKYHSVASRIKIIRATHASQSKRDAMAWNLKPSDDVYADPIHGSRIIGS